MKVSIKYLAIVFSFFMLFSCKEKNNYFKIDNSQTASKSNTHKIIVNEFIEGGTYAYLNVKENDKIYWMAIPNSKVNVGETYFYDGGMIMKNFESKQLNKTFDEITFVEGIRTTEKKLERKVNPHSNTTNVKQITVNISKPENGTSIEELFSNKENYSNKDVIIKGKVVKVNNAILERNWVHLVDGTQYENKKSVTVSTKEIVKVGDTVTFKGKVVLDKDFGYGYIYNLLVEEGVIVK